MRAKYVVIGVVLGVLLSSVAVVLAGSLDSPGAPTDAAAQMYTLEQIYDHLTTGAAATKNTTFTEPGSGPGTGTMHTLDDIYDAIPYGGCDCASGTLNGTRWCDNGDGTVTDLLGYNSKGQCLVWLQKADWGGLKPWRHSSTYDDAHSRASHLDAGDETWLNDGSVEGDWRLPTKSELVAITDSSGTEYVRSGSMRRAFTGVQSEYYWSSTSDGYSPNYAWFVYLDGYYVHYGSKDDDYYVWPVRVGQ